MDNNDNKWSKKGILRKVGEAIIIDFIWDGAKTVYDWLINNDHSPQQPQGEPHPGPTGPGSNDPRVINSIFADAIGHSSEKIINHPEIAAVIRKYAHVLEDDRQPLDDPFNHEGQAFLREFKPKLESVLVPRVHYALKTHGVIDQNQTLPHHYSRLSSLFAGR